MSTLEASLAALLAGLVPLILQWVRVRLFGPEVEATMLQCAVGAHKAARIFEGQGERPSAEDIERVAIANAKTALPVHKRPLSPGRVYAKVLPAAQAQARGVE